MTKIRQAVWLSAATPTLAAAFVLAGAPVFAQNSTGAAQNGAGQSSSGSSSLQSVTQAQQQVSQPSVTVTPQNNAGAGSVATGNNPYKGSIVRDKATSQVLDLALGDAIQRGLKNNLGLVLQSAQEKSANGQRLEQLQPLLPTVTGSASIEVEQVNLATFGLSFPGLNPIVGPFQVIDFRAYLTQNLVNVQALQNYLAAKHNFTSAKLTAEDARNLVVLTVGNAYLLCIADQARIDAVSAQMASSKVSLDQATQAHDAGTSPRLDVLRAQVDYQNEQQNLIAATNELAKDRIALARTIGLPLDQKFTLSETVPFAAFDTPDAQAAFEQAVKQRKDLAAAVESLKGADAAHTAARAEQLPVASFSGDFGDIGKTPAHSHGTYSATGTVSAPILQIAKTRGDELVAEAQADQARAKLSDQLQQVNADVRDAILDIETAAKLVAATKSNVDLSHEALQEAEERFKAGVSDNLPVSEALATSRQADDQYISALYQHNVAKLSLARALGVAATDYKTYVSGTPVPVTSVPTAPAVPATTLNTAPESNGAGATGAAQTNGGGK